MCVHVLTRILAKRVVQRQAGAGTIWPFTDFGMLAPTFGRVGGFLRPIEQEIDQMLQVFSFLRFVCRSPRSLLAAAALQSLC